MFYLLDGQVLKPQKKEELMEGEEEEGEGEEEEGEGEGEEGEGEGEEGQGEGEGEREEEGEGEGDGECDEGSEEDMDDQIDPHFRGEVMKALGSVAAQSEDEVTQLSPIKQCSIFLIVTVSIPE